MAVQIVFPDPSFMVIMSHGVPDPVMVGVASAVANGAVASPPRVPGVDGRDGGVVSMVSVSGVLVVVQLVGTMLSHWESVRGVGVDSVAVTRIE